VISFLLVNNKKSNYNSGIIKKIVKSNKFWYLIAFVFFISTLFTYFKIFQPNVLNEYGRITILNSNSMLVDFEQKSMNYNSNIINIAKSEKKLIDNTSCGINSKFKDYDKQLSMLNELNKSLKPEEKFNKNSEVLSFYDKDILQLNQQNYNTYKSSFNTLQKENDKIISNLNYLQQRNTLIENCTTILNSVTNEPVKKSCENILKTVTEIKKIPIYPAKKPIEEIVQKCEETKSNSFNYSSSWLLQYLNLQNQVITSEFIVDTPNIQEKIEKESEQTKKTFSQREKLINEYIKEKQKNENLFYLLDFNLNFSKILNFFK
jgi:hypothetical protein